MQPRCVQVQWWCELHAGLGQAGCVQAGCATEQPREAATCPVSEAAPAAGSHPTAPAPAAHAESTLAAHQHLLAARISHTDRPRHREAAAHTGMRLSTHSKHTAAGVGERLTTYHPSCSWRRVHTTSSQMPSCGSPPDWPSHCPWSRLR